MFAYIFLQTNQFPILLYFTHPFPLPLGRAGVGIQKKFLPLPIAIFGRHGNDRNFCIFFLSANFPLPGKQKKD